MTIQVATVPEVGNAGIQTKVDRATYLANLLKLRADLPTSVTGLAAIRDRATVRVQELAIPSTKDEEWRFTDLSSLLQVNFQAVSSAATVTLSDIQAFILPEANLHRLVFVDGLYAPELSAVGQLPAGTVVTSLNQTSAWQNHLATLPGSEDVFTALNTASFTDGAIAILPRNQETIAPVHLLFVSTTQAPQISHPRCLVVVGTGSSLTLIEDYVALGEGGYFTNPVTEIHLEENAQVNHTRVQRDSKAAFHIGKTAISQARDSRYTGTTVNLGATLSRHNLEVYQTGEQTETTLNGLTLVDGDQTADTHSAIALTKPHGTTNQIHKCIIDDHAHAVFNGKVFVPKAAQLTNAAQLSRNLLLSPKARVDTKPQLEITADNVKCSHGATVSQLEGDEVFYLQSRGIDQDTARRLLVYAFAYEVISQIPVAPLQETLAQFVKAHF